MPADAILDHIVQGSHHFRLQGKESMRGRKGTAARERTATHE